MSEAAASSFALTSDAYHVTWLYTSLAKLFLQSIEWLASLAAVVPKAFLSLGPMGALSSSTWLVVMSAQLGLAWSSLQDLACQRAAATGARAMPLVQQFRSLACWRRRCFWTLANSDLFTKTRGNFIVKLAPSQVVCLSDKNNNNYKTTTDIKSD